MPTPTYDLIASNVLASPASSVSFSSLPAGYRDLVLVAEVERNGGEIVGNLRLNGDTGSNYSSVTMNGDGTNAYSSSGTGTSLLGIYADNAAIRAMGIWQLLDYSATDKHKSILFRRNNAASETLALAGRWANTAAVNEVTIVTATNSFASGSTFYLYGIVS